MLKRLTTGSRFRSSRSTRLATRRWLCAWLVGGPFHALGVTLALESLNHFEHYLTTTAHETAALCREVDHPQCRMLYDTFHAHMEEKDLREAIVGCADVLAYIHLSESDRSPAGSAQVDWSTTFATFREIGYDGWPSS